MAAKGAVHQEAVPEQPAQELTTAVSTSNPDLRPAGASVDLIAGSTPEHHVPDIVTPDPTLHNTSQRKIDANRRNAQKSTGPRTVRGKKYSSLNAAKHGLLSHAVVVFGNEDPRAFEELLAALVEALQPGAKAETVVVHEIAEIKWRLRRIPRHEAGRIRQQIDKAVAESDQALARKLVAAGSDEILCVQVRNEESLRLEATLEALVLPPLEEVEKIDRHERTLELRLFRKYAELERLKRARAAELGGTSGADGTQKNEGQVMQ